MPNQAHRLVNLDIAEMSGVDRPAHLHDGWLVIKNAGGLRDVLNRARRTDDKESNMPDGINVDTITDDATRKAVEALIAENAALSKQATADDDGAELAEARKQWEADLATLAKSADDTDQDEDIMKNLPDEVRKMLDERDERIAKAEAQAAETSLLAKAERYARVESEYIAKTAAEFPHLAGAKDGSLAKSLLALDIADPDAAAEVRKSLAAAHGQIESADIFRSIGSDFDADGDSAEGKLDALAKQRASEKGEDFATAYAAVLDSTEGRTLYKQIAGGNA